jgi:glycosyltransferase involved in cell wall biosynthesis/O-antigen/teichoic acid export membrane protein
MKKIKTRIIGKAFSLYEQFGNSGSLVAAAMVANFFNFLFNAYLGRVTGFEEFGVISLIGSFLTIAQIPFSSYSRAVTQKSAYLLGKYETPAKYYWKRLRSQCIWISLLITVVWILFIPFLTSYFKTSQIWPFVFLTPILTIGLAGAIDAGFLTGSMQFITVAVMTVAEVITKFLVTVLAVQLHAPNLIFASIPISAMVSFLIGWIWASRVKAKKVIVEHQRNTYKFPTQFFVSSILSKLATISFLSADVIMAKHYLSPKEAGQYAILSLCGKMVYFFGTLFYQFIVPYVSRDEGAGKNSEHIFRKILFVSVAVVGFAYVAFGVLGFLTAPILFGSKAQAIIGFLPGYGLAMACLAIAGAFVSFHQSRHVHIFAVISFFFSLVMIGFMTIFHRSIADFNMIITVSGVLYLVGIILLDRQYKRVITIGRNLRDMIGIFFDHNPKLTHEGLRILIFNWRDTKHVWTGGAEVYIHELAKRWVGMGHNVTLFCGNDQQHARNEIVDGVRVVRRGGFYTVYLWAMLYYIFRFRGHYDVIVDSENGVPFFTPLYARIPVVLVIHHVHQEILKKHLPFPLSRFAMALESKAMPSLYGKSKIITVSESSKDEIIRLGFDTEDIHIVRPGTDKRNDYQSPKTKYPSLLYLGRLRAYKRLDVALEAFSFILQDYPEAVFTIAGEGDNMQELKDLSEALHVSKSVQFLGRVTDQKKAELLSASWVMVQPSSMEGWGLTVIEANMYGTPVVASFVNGLRDAVVHGQTGFLVPVGESKMFARTIGLVFGHKELRQKLSEQAYAWSQLFNWDEGAKSAIDILKKEIIFSQRPGKFSLLSILFHQKAYD